MDISQGRKAFHKGGGENHFVWGREQCMAGRKKRAVLNSAGLLGGHSLGGGSSDPSHQEEGLLQNLPLLCGIHGECQRCWSPEKAHPIHL